MQKFLKKATLLAALVAAGAANATTIAFEQSKFGDGSSVDSLLVEGDLFADSGFLFGPFSNAAGAQPGDLVGAMVDGSQLAATCFAVSCPTNNSSHFYTALNDGVLYMAAQNGAAFSVQGFSAAFLGASGETLPSVAGLLRLQGVKADGSGSINYTVQLAGPASGSLSFADFSTSGAFATTLFSEVYFYGFTCNSAGSCSAFSTDRGQFALDNINVTAVPEPSQWMLMALGLGGVGAVLRRRRGEQAA